MKPQCYFVTGTDTGVGKTQVASALLLSAQAHGLRGLGLKPVAAGCAHADGRLVNEDALLLQRCSSLSADYAAINPVALEPAIAPHLAAAQAGIVLRAAELADHVRAQAASGAEALLVEGAGGWLVPLNETETMADLAVALGYPVILVVGMRLGCINHALLTAAAITAAGLQLAGWVANGVTPEMEALAENVRALEQRLPALRLGTVPFLAGGCTPERLNTWLDATSLFGAR
ncbi:MAG: dethiobiotin synthetase [Pseudomonadota bacterium]|jgi:dethiobiotin synthetase|nr:dethiobiotin synthetase [Pseudomonadota bacterium]